MNRVVALIVFSIISSAVCIGQNFDRNHIVGTWHCTEVSYSGPVARTPDERSVVEKTKRGLLNAQFVFRPNGTFFMQLPTGAPEEFKELATMNNKMWHIRATERLVFVGSLDEDLMTISVRSHNGTSYFLIQDTPLMLRVEKRR